MAQTDQTDQTESTVLVVAPFPLDEEGGAATVVHGLNGALRKLGWKTVTAAPSGGDEPLRLAEWGGQVLTQWRDVCAPGLSGKVKKLVREHGAKAVHFHNFAGGLSATAVANVAGSVRTVLTLHDNYALCHRGGFVLDSGEICAGPGLRCLTCVPRVGRRELHRPFRKGRIRRLLCAPVAVVSPSVSAQLLLEQYGYTNVRTIPNGVDLDHFSPAVAEGAEGERADAPLRLLVVGRASRQKGVHVAAEAVELLRATHELSVELTWVGPRAEAAAARVGVAGFIGRDTVAHAELPELYRAADIVLVPSLARETFGLSAAEAMACGRPVIASEIGGLPEVVAGSGITVKPGDAAALAAAVFRLAGDAEARKRMSELAARSAIHRFSWLEAARSYAHEYLSQEYAKPH